VADFNLNDGPGPEPAAVLCHEGFDRRQGLAADVEVAAPAVDAEEAAGVVVRGNSWPVLLSSDSGRLVDGDAPGPGCSSRSL
jgi:hypothetical protein